MTEKKRKARRHLGLRDLPSYLFKQDRLPDEFREWGKTHLLPKLSFTGYKVSTKRDIALHALRHLIATGLVGGCVADARDWHSPGARLRLQVWDAICDAGMAICCIGSEAAGVQTRYAASRTLLKMQKDQNDWELKALEDLRLERNTEAAEPTEYALVVLHTGKVNLVTGDPLPLDKQKRPLSIDEYVRRNAQRGPDLKEPDPQAVQNGLNYFRAIEDVIEEINSNNLDFSWKAFRTEPKTGRRRSLPVNPCLRQINVDRLFRAARLYGWGPLNGQGLPKEIRRSMLIDGEPVAELDFSGMATRLLYHMKGIKPKGDVYRPKKIMPIFHAFENTSDEARAIVRDFIKRCTNICWNVTTRHAARGAIYGLLGEHPEKPFIEKVLRTENTYPDDLIKRIRRAHRALKDDFFTEIGFELMSLDGKIMLQILSAFTKASKPALGIHDAVLCRVSDAEFARETMTEVYKRFLRFRPVIKRTF